MVSPAASTSATARPVTAVSLSSSPATAPGRVLTGASLTAVTVTVTWSSSVSEPPAPVLPRSSLFIVRVSAPLKFWSGV